MEKRPIPTTAERLRTFMHKTWHPALLLLFMGIVAFWIYSEASSSYRWQWYRVWRYFGRFTDQGFSAGPLLEGLYTTLELTAVSLVLAVFTGLLIVLCRLSPSPVARLFASLFLGCIRNTPLLMQLFVMYFVVAPVFGLDPFASAVLALAVFEGSYLSEIFRAGITSIPKSQWEAAFSLGMSTAFAARWIIMPQALRNVLPALAGQLISLIKDTSLVSAIAVTDLTMRARDVISDTYLSFEIWLLVAVIYLFLTCLVSVPSAILGRKQKKQV